MDRLPIDRAMLIRSTMPRGRRADRTASGTETANVMTSAYSTSSRVTGRCCPRIDVTLWL
jgi:hypothetical protein